MKEKRNKMEEFKNKSFHQHTQISYINPQFLTNEFPKHNSIITTNPNLPYLSTEKSIKNYERSQKTSPCDLQNLSFFLSFKIYQLSNSSYNTKILT